MSYVSLTPVDLALAAVLIVLNGLVSWLLRLGLEQRIAIAVLRMVVQLALVGVVLKFVLEQSSALVTLLAAAVMVTAAGYEAVARQDRPIKGWRTLGLGTGTLLVIGTATTLYATAVVIAPEPVLAPRYVLPILGMVLGNALTGISLVLNAAGDSVHRERAGIEARLAHGATRLEALAGPIRHAVRTGMIPILNAMAATGLVTLPGMMSGQILSGIDPVEAAKYQVMIMFVIAGATALAVVAAAYGGAFLLTDARHRLRLDRLSPPRE